MSNELLNDAPIETNEAANPLNDTAPAEAAEKKPAAPRFTSGVSHPIITGKMPLLLVFLIRKEGVWDIEDMIANGATQEEVDAAKKGMASRLAKKYATTVGKVNDILTGAGFPYINDRNMGTTVALIENVRAHLYDKDATVNKEVVGQGHYDEEIAAAIFKEINEMPQWTDAQLDELLAVRRASRKNASDEATQAGNEAEAKKGKRGKKDKAKAEAATDEAPAMMDTEPSGDVPSDLLAE